MAERKFIITIGDEDVLKIRDWIFEVSDEQVRPHDSAGVIKEIFYLDTSAPLHEYMDLRDKVTVEEVCAKCLNILSMKD